MKGNPSDPRKMRERAGYMNYLSKRQRGQKDKVKQMNIKWRD